MTSHPTSHPLIGPLIGLLVGLPVGLPGVLLGTSTANAGDGPVPVEIIQGAAGWEMLRGGEPYHVRGAGWGTPMETIVAAGGNTIRTWGVASNTPAMLDAAHELGLTVVMGLWMNHPGNGMNYSDLDAVAAQEASLLAQAAAIKDHPAILGWGVGNEVEMNDDSPAIWRAIGSLASALKKMDPDHLTIAVTAEIGAAHDYWLGLYCPDIDVWGINTYAAMPSLPSRLSSRDYDGPYLVTEYAGAGPWEVQKTSWGAPHEPTSTEKAAGYLDRWTSVIEADDARCLGGFPFIWRPAADPADTWFPMLTWDARPLGAIDAMTEAWTGSPPADLAPTISDITISDQTLEPGAVFQAEVNASDPEEGGLVHEWFFARDLFDGSGTWTGCSATVRCLDIDAATITTEAPAEAGPWRLFAVATDSNGSAAMSSIPILIEGDDDGYTASPTFAVDDHFSPTGWMGDVAALSLQTCDAPDPDCGGRCHQLTWTPTSGGWFGVLWQFPPNNWGSMPGLDIAPGADAVRFQAWSESGITATFRAGGSAADGFERTVIATLDATPRTLEIDLSGIDYDDIATGFGIVVSGGGSTRDVSISDIEWIRDPAPCPADLTGDGEVDSADLGLLIAAWNSRKSPADLDASGRVDAADLGLLIGAWGSCNP